MTECQIPDIHPEDNEIDEILQSMKTIAIVGLSDNDSRDSYKVAKYLKEKGFTIVPVNPSKQRILGEPCYPDLLSIPMPVDIVDVFRKTEAIPGIADEALQIRPKVFWLQLGLTHNETAKKLRCEGIQVIQSRCLKIEHRRFYNN
mgnify:CR=1 FL=1